MSAKPVVLDRKARRALMFVGVLLLLMVAFAVRGYISRISENDLTTHPVASDERLVIVDGATMLVQPEAFGQTMRSWLDSSQQQTLSFELSDKSFQPNSALPSRMSVTRIAQLASLAKARPTLVVHILQPSTFQSPAMQQLNDQRAARLRQELIANGVSESNVTIEEEREGLATAKSPHLAVLLTK